MSNIMYWPYASRLFQGSARNLDTKPRNRRSSRKLGQFFPKRGKFQKSSFQDSQEPNYQEYTRLYDDVTECFVEQEYKEYCSITSELVKWYVIVWDIGELIDNSSQSQRNFPVNCLLVFQSLGLVELCLFYYVVFVHFASVILNCQFSNCRKFSIENFNCR